MLFYLFSKDWNCLPKELKYFQVGAEPRIKKSIDGAFKRKLEKSDKNKQAKTMKIKKESPDFIDMEVLAKVIII